MIISGTSIGDAKVFNCHFCKKTRWSTALTKKASIHSKHYILTPLEFSIDLDFFDEDVALDVELILGICGFRISYFHWKSLDENVGKMRKLFQSHFVRRISVHLDFQFTRVLCVYEQDSRPQPAYFPPRSFPISKRSFQKDESVFSKKNYLQQSLTNFPNIKIFWFLQKTLTSAGKKAFLQNSIVWYAFYNKFANFTVLKKFKFFFTKSIVFFLKRKQFLYLLTNFKAV